MLPGTRTRESDASDREQKPESPTQVDVPGATMSPPSDRTVRDYGDERHEIDVDNVSDRHIQTDECVEALVALNEFVDDPQVYLQGNVLTRVTTFDGATRLEPMASSSLQELMSAAATFWKRGRDNEPFAVPAPAWMASQLLHRRPSDLPGIPQVERVVGVPVFGPDRGEETQSQTVRGYIALPRGRSSSRIRTSPLTWRACPTPSRGVSSIRTFSGRPRTPTCSTTRPASRWRS